VHAWWPEAPVAERPGPLGHIRPSRNRAPPQTRSPGMNRIIYIVGLIVVVLVILGFLGLR